MKNLAKIFRFDFLPRSSDLALLLLRLWFGGSLLFLHGWMKLTNFDTMSKKFLDFLGIGSQASLVLALFGEVVCAALLIVGLFTRFAALVCGITMSVAFLLAHKAVLKGPGSGEMAFIYLAAFVALFLAGGGRFSLDAKLGGKV